MILFRDGLVLYEGSTLSQRFSLKEGEHLNLALGCLDEGGDAVLDITLEGPGATFNLAGLYLCSGDERLNIRVNLRHLSGECLSEQLFKGIVKDSAHAIFDGLVHVAPDAQKTEALQTNRNLLLSPDALVQSSPQLEIWADDVKCSHGATCGSLDENEQFYMRSRGITLEEARRLQMISFLAPVAEQFPEDYKEKIYSTLAQW